MHANRACLFRMEEEHRRALKCIQEISKRVELMREQAISIEREKETLLATLQQIQDNPELAKLPEGTPV